MKALLYTNEYPPYVYGGAGIHVEYLSRELSRLCDVEVRCFGDQDAEAAGLKARGFGLDKSGFDCPKTLESVFGSLRRGVDFNAAGLDADLVHLHTWYTHFAGILSKMAYRAPMVLTVHSLEPLRPWKREQLGGGYEFSLWIEKTAIEMADAVVAVSVETRNDILRLFNVPDDRVHVIHNGIDLDEYKPVESTAHLERHGIRTDQPYMLFVGRITRQKGIIHLVNAIRYMDPGYQVVLCAGAPDTPEIGAEMQEAVGKVQAERDGVFWVQEMLDLPAKVEFYSHADVFCCPSIYEPFGIINLEAMACETAVVASAVGGIKEVVVERETGFLIPLNQQSESPFEALHPEQFAQDIAEKINTLMADPELRRTMARNGRKRAEDLFSWSAIAGKVHGLYEDVLANVR